MNFTEEDLREAFKAGHERGRFDAHNNYFDAPLDEDEYIVNLTPKIEPEETVKVTYSMIRATIGWSRFCDVTDKNHYAINEFGHYDDGEVFEITKIQFNKLWK
jgi:hypothetical protein